MGKLMYDLRSVSKIPTDLDDLLKRALKKRNWLAHEFFRESATEFLTSIGRDQMLTEVDECRDLFKAADEALEKLSNHSFQQQESPTKFLNASIKPCWPICNWLNL